MDAVSTPPPVAPVIPGYELHALLRQDSDGEVWRATRLVDHRTVAVHLLPAARPEALEHFRLFVECVAQLHHPRFVEVYEIGAAGGIPFLAREHMDGGSLSDHLAGTPLKPHDAAVLVEQLARAVQVAHVRYLIHRDLRPANVLLATDGTEATEGKSAFLSVPPVPSVAKITGFGMPALTGREGDPCYMAPEQVSGGEIGLAVDIYSLGALLYECLTGRPPFRGPTPQETRDQLRYHDPVPPRHLQPGLPHDLDTITLQCLQKEPDRRYASAGVLADDLRRFLRSEEIQARPGGVRERFRKGLARRPEVMTLGVLILASVIAAIVASTWSAIEAGRRADDATAEAQREHVRAQVALSLSTQMKRQTDLVMAEQKKTAAELERWQTALALELLAPLGRSTGPLDTAERDALWRLAAQPTGFGVCILDMGMRDSASATRLARRADFLVCAAAGLDPTQRRQLSDVIMTGLRKAKADPAVREAWFQLGLALGGEMSYHDVFQVALATADDRDDATLLRLVPLVFAAPRLWENDPMSIRLAVLLAERVKKAPTPAAKAPLLRALSLLAPRLTPKVAATMPPLPEPLPPMKPTDRVPSWFAGRDAQAAAVWCVETLAGPSDGQTQQRCERLLAAAVAQLSAAHLVAVLKMPTCVGPAAATVLMAVSERCGQRFLDVAAFAHWARVRAPELDLTSPPTRPW